MNHVSDETHLAELHETSLRPVDFDDPPPHPHLVDVAIGLGIGDVLEQGRPRNGLNLAAQSAAGTTGAQSISQSAMLEAPELFLATPSSS